MTAPTDAAAEPTRDWAALGGHRGAQLAVLMAFALVLNREGFHCPAGNEWVYLLYVWKAYHPSFLAADWTFRETTAGHAVFNYAAGWLTLAMPLTAAAWVGRLACWAGAFVGLLRLGRHYRLPQWAVGLGVLAWMMGRQSFVTDDWVVGSFEAKCVGYVCLIFGLDAALRHRAVLSGVLCGLAFSFHTAVGLWGGAAVGLAVLLDGPVRRTLAFSAAAVACSLPGLITSLPLIVGGHAIPAAEAEFWVTKALPTCMDPTVFPVGSIALLAALAAFAGWHARLSKGDRAVRFLATFELATAAAFAFGVVARLTGRFGLVELYPLRVFATVAVLLFWWQLASLLTRRDRPASVPAVAAAVVLALAIPSPVWQTWELIAMHVPRLRTTPGVADSADEDRDFRAAAAWVVAHTPVDAVVIAPPWRTDGYYALRRPLVANFHTPRYDAMAEWHRRIEALTGAEPHVADEVAGDMGPAARTIYEHLTPAALDDVRARYGGDYLVTGGTYAYPALFRAGRYAVYQLPPRP